jgi:hypothetical protein
MQISNRIVYDLAGDFTLFNYVHEYIVEPRKCDEVIKIIGINAVKETARRIWDILERDYDFIAPDELKERFNGETVKDKRKGSW